MGRRVASVYRGMDIGHTALGVAPEFLPDRSQSTVAQPLQNRTIVGLLTQHSLAISDMLIAAKRRGLSISSCPPLFSEGDRASSVAMTRSSILWRSSGRRAVMGGPGGCRGWTEPHADIDVWGAVGGGGVAVDGLSATPTSMCGALWWLAGKAVSTWVFRMSCLLFLVGNGQHPTILFPLSKKKPKKSKDFSQKPNNKTHS